MMNMNKQLLHFNFFLILLLPISFVIGPLIVEIISTILILQFLYFSFKQKNFFYIKNKIFIFFILFYIFLLITLFFSEYKHNIYVNIIFNFRFIFFAFAIHFFLISNFNFLKKIYIFLSLTILIVIFDGFWQYFYDENLLGYKKYRVDRISGFFKEDLVLGSFLSRLIPLHIGLTLFFKKNKRLTFVNSFIIIATIILILLSGDRAAFFKTIIFLVIIFIILNIRFKIKLGILSSILFSVMVLILSNPILFDRYYKQTLRHLSNDNGKLLEFYSPMFNTSLKMFNSSKLIGHGPKSYRYLCNNKKYISYYPDYIKIDNTSLYLDLSWKEIRNFEITKFLVSEGDMIKKGDKLFEYKFLRDDEIKFFFSDKEGKINKILRKTKYVKNTKIMDISPLNSPKKEFLKKNSCNTHPHNFYFQLLAETGLIGFLFLLILFLYLGYILLMSFINKFTKKKQQLSNIELSLLAGFFVTVWPFTTNGNFFNNWIQLITFFPLGILIYIQYLKRK